MPDALNNIKPGIRQLRAYSLRPDRARIKLNQNENPWEAPLEIREETLRRLPGRSWSRYPDFYPQRLCEKLADFAGWKTDGIIAGNGSNELIQATLMVTVAPGTRVLIAEPTFALYRQITTLLGGEVISVPLNDQLRYDGHGLLTAVREFQPGVTIICSPNNPTGCVMSDDDLGALLKSTNGIVVIDEAYHEFAEHSVVPLLREHENLVVLRTFSKAMAMAGLRVGYLLAATDLAREISKAMLPYNLNAISQIAAEVAVELYEAKLRPLVQRVIAERERLYGELSRINGLKPVRSRANFILVRSAIDPGRVYDELLRQQILIRDVSSYPMLRDYFRVSVGTPDENNQLLEALRQIFGLRITTELFPTNVRNL